MDTNIPNVKQIEKSESLTNIKKSDNISIIQRDDSRLGYGQIVPKKMQNIE